jgi:hypothetical protein
MTPPTIATYLKYNNKTKQLTSITTTATKSITKISTTLVYPNQPYNNNNNKNKSSK